MDDIFVLHLDDYIQHIDDKLTLYAMLRQLESEINKLPEREDTSEVRKRMAVFSPRLDELWDGWNIPLSYLVTGELDDLSDLMGDELIEPEDAGFFCKGSYAASDDGDVSEYREALIDLGFAFLGNTFAKLSRFASELQNDCENMETILDVQDE